MSRLPCVLLAAALALPAAGLGCGNSDNKPNPELKAPEVPPGRGAGPAAQPKDINKAKK